MSAADQPANPLLEFLELVRGLRRHMTPDECSRAAALICSLVNDAVLGEDE